MNSWRVTAEPARVPSPRLVYKGSRRLLSLQLTVHEFLRALTDLPHFARVCVLVPKGEKAVCELMASLTAEPACVPSPRLVYKGSRRLLSLQLTVHEFLRAKAISLCWLQDIQAETREVFLLEEQWVRPMSRGPADGVIPYAFEHFPGALPFFFATTEGAPILQDIKLIMRQKFQSEILQQVLQHKATPWLAGLRLADREWQRLFRQRTREDARLIVQLYSGSNPCQYMVLRNARPTERGYEEKYSWRHLCPVCGIDDVGEYPAQHPLFCPTLASRRERLYLDIIRIFSDGMDRTAKRGGRLDMQALTQSLWINVDVDVVLTPLKRQAMLLAVPASHIRRHCGFHRASDRALERVVQAVIEYWRDALALHMEKHREFMVGLMLGVEAKLAATPAPEGEEQGTDLVSAPAQEHLPADSDSDSDW